MGLIIIPGTFPNMNQIIAGRKNPWSAYEKFKQMYTDLVTVAVKNRYTPITNYPVSVHFDWYCKDRRTDPANIATTKEMVINGLVAGGILVGGGWVHIHGFSDKFFVDDENPRVVVSIREREES